MATNTNNVVNSFKKLTVEERAEMKEKFADVSTQIFVVRLNVLISLVWYCVRMEMVRTNTFTTS